MAASREEQRIEEYHKRDENFKMLIEDCKKMHPDVVIIPIHNSTRKWRFIIPKEYGLEKKMDFIYFMLPIIKCYNM